MYVCISELTISRHSRESSHHQHKLVPASKMNIHFASRNDTSKNHYSTALVSPIEMAIIYPWGCVGGGATGNKLNTDGGSCRWRGAGHVF